MKKGKRGTRREKRQRGKGGEKRERRKDRRRKEKREKRIICSRCFRRKVSKDCIRICQQSRFDFLALQRGQGSRHTFSFSSSNPGNSSRFLISFAPSLEFPLNSSLHRDFPLLARNFPISFVLVDGRKQSSHRILLFPRLHLIFCTSCVSSTTNVLGRKEYRVSFCF